jgi:hypothetical protein
VPETLKTEALYIVAVKQHKWTLRYVPTALQAKVKKAAGIE